MCVQNENEHYSISAYLRLKYCVILNFWTKATTSRYVGYYWAMRNIHHFLSENLKRNVFVWNSFSNWIILFNVAAEISNMESNLLVVTASYLDGMSIQDSWIKSISQCFLHYWADFLSDSFIAVLSHIWTFFIDYLFKIKYIKVTIAYFISSSREIHLNIFVINIEKEQR